jgi:uncharacterized damage-inducible protein DinB
MNELSRTLISNGVAAPPKNILQAIPEEVAHRRFASVPHSIYEEVWHLAFWQELTLDWIEGRPTPYPAHASEGFPRSMDERWDALQDRFLAGVLQAAHLAEDTDRLSNTLSRPAVPGGETTPLDVREQLESLAAHNAYHLGRIVLLRQLSNCWPPPDGGDGW